MITIHQRLTKASFLTGNSGADSKSVIVVVKRWWWQWKSYVFKGLCIQFLSTTIRSIGGRSVTLTCELRGWTMLHPSDCLQIWWWLHSDPCTVQVQVWCTWTSTAIHVGTDQQSLKPTVLSTYPQSYHPAARCSEEICYSIQQWVEVGQEKCQGSFDGSLIKNGVLFLF